MMATEIFNFKLKENRKIVQSYLYVMKANTNPTRETLLPRTISRDRTLCSVRTGSIVERLKLAKPCSFDVNKVSIARYTQRYQIFNRENSLILESKTGISSPARFYLIQLIQAKTSFPDVIKERKLLIEKYENRKSINRKLFKIIRDGVSKYVPVKIISKTSARSLKNSQTVHYRVFFGFLSENFCSLFETL